MIEPRNSIMAMEVGQHPAVGCTGGGAEAGLHADLRGLAKSEVIAGKGAAD